VDRQALVFVHGGSATSRLWRVPVSGDTEAKQLVLSGGVEFGPAIAPVGDRLAFTSNNTSVNIWSFPVLGPGAVGPAKQTLTSARSSYASLRNRSGGELSLGHSDGSCVDTVAMVSNTPSFLINL
jgi:Tol biopolymer transport system component